MYVCKCSIDSGAHACMSRARESFPAKPGCNGMKLAIAGGLPERSKNKEEAIPSISSLCSFSAPSPSPSPSPLQLVARSSSYSFHFSVSTLNKITSSPSPAPAFQCSLILSAHGVKFPATPFTSLLLFFFFHVRGSS